jgi:gamma-glutamyltranspeptidase/glutathione hydrolase
MTRFWSLFSFCLAAATWRGAKSAGSSGPTALAMVLVLQLNLAWVSGAERPPIGSGEQAIAATIHPLATDAAIQAMRQGGNAVDAAIAAALTLGVVDGHNSGLGGGCFMLIRLADGRVVAIDGREKAPAAATRDMFLRNGQPDTKLSQTGALAAGVPGALAAYEYAATNFGQLPLASHFTVAAQLAEHGFPLNRSYAQRLAATAEELRQFEASRVALLKPDGSPWEAGELLRQPDLAAGYRAIADQGSAWFYRGPFARQTEQWMRANGGLLTAEDFSRYTIELREPVRTVYRGFEILGFPPPSSGGAHVAQILNILEQFKVRKLRAGSADFIHVVTEAMKLAFADRAFWLGDPAFAKVPRGLVSKEYGAELANRIDRRRATPVAGHGTPSGATTDFFGKHTTHFSTADRAGNWVACTATINTSFGSKVVVPGTGIILNNQMDDFSIQPGVANAFGLVGAEANAVAPGKRPLSSMSPTIVLRNGHPVLSLGAAGGPTIISQTVLTLLYVLDFEMPLEKALAQVRFHHQWQPDELRIERKAGEDVIRDLERRGHRVRVVEELGATQAVSFDDSKKRFAGAADPRSEGIAGGF